MVDHVLLRVRERKEFFDEVDYGHLTEAASGLE